MIREPVTDARTARSTIGETARLLSALKLDGPLLGALALLALFALVVQYSASGQNLPTVLRSLGRFGLGGVLMLVLSQVSANSLRRFAPWLYLGGVALLLVVEVMGLVSKGAQRWIDLGVLRFQPSEIMKLAVPMMAAAWLHSRPLPPGWRDLMILTAMIMVPAGLIALQPDLGTSLLIVAGGFLLLLMAGLQWQIIAALALLAGVGAVVGWNFLHDYQQQRIRIFLDPSSDPLGSGYHISQSQIAIGSGGLIGKGWLNGSQAQLDFLPESSTDFIFAVIGEEFGLLGLVALVGLYFFIASRALYLASQTSDTFSRLLTSSLALTFLVYVIINTGMACGLLPVVGVPLPLVSYGGTSLVTLLGGFGILMGLYAHRKLVGV